MGVTHVMGDPERWTWVGFYTVVLVVHLRHAHPTDGAHRLWHGGHALMAVAMVCMLLPVPSATTSAPLWFVGTGGAAGAALVYASLSHWDGVRIDRQWVTLVVGLAATAYMWLMTAEIAVAPLTYAAAAWLVGETLGWFTGALCRPRPASPVPSPPPGSAERRVVAAAGSAVAPTLARATVAPEAPRPWPAEEPPLTATGVERLALGLSALGMAYLLVVMQQMPMH